jgi:hypothetical protein
MENIYRHQAIKCPFCQTIAPLMPFGKDFMAICMSCKKIVYESKNTISIPGKVRERKETLDFSKTNPVGG